MEKVEVKNKQLFSPETDTIEVIAAEEADRQNKINLECLLRVFVITTITIQILLFLFRFFFSIFCK